MRIYVHDYAGHAFPIQLSRALAARGHTVRHGYCASLRTTPTGALAPADADPPTLSIEGLHLKKPLDKFSFVTRWRQENEYGRLARQDVAAFRPDVVLSGNTPLDAQRMLLRTCRRQGFRFAYWVQDLLGIATDRILRRKLPVAGALAGRYYVALERQLLQQSDTVVLITEDFHPIMDAYGVEPAHRHVVENWAPLADIPERPRRNPWAEAHGLADRRVLLYSGTLALKHNPDLLLQLALRFREEPDVRVVVVSQGLGADWLRDKKSEHGLDNLVLLGFQPFEDLPDVLASADVLLAILEPDAGVFSVPSKVLSYLCAGRPTLLAVPRENLAARIVTRHEAGLVVDPTDAGGFVDAGARLLAEPDVRSRMGSNARRYAEHTFAIDRIAAAFEDLLSA